MKWDAQEAYAGTFGLILGIYLDLLGTLPVVAKYFAIIPPFGMLGQLFVNAPFGRFALKEKSFLQVDGMPSPQSYKLISKVTLQVSNLGCLWRSLLHIHL